MVFHPSSRRFYSIHSVTLLSFIEPYLYASDARSFPSVRFDRQPTQRNIIFRSSFMMMMLRGYCCLLECSNSWLTWSSRVVHRWRTHRLPQRRNEKRPNNGWHCRQSVSHFFVAFPLAPTHAPQPRPQLTSPSDECHRHCGVQRCRTKWLSPKTALSKMRSPPFDCFSLIDRKFCAIIVSSQCAIRHRA